MSFRIPSELLKEIEERAKELGVPKSMVVREAIAAYVVGRRPAQRASSWERVKSLAGAIELDPAAVESNEIARAIRRHNWRQK